MPKAIKNLRSLPKTESQKILAKIKMLESGLVGDIKKLTHFTLEYRLRVGDYRVLFEIIRTKNNNLSRKTPKRGLSLKEVIFYGSSSTIYRKRRKTDVCTASH
jgi:mRNA interferase RelE/StbE